MNNLAIKEEPEHRWQLRQEKFDLERNVFFETLFSVANGYIGMRGTFEEGIPSSPLSTWEGNYINGFFDNEVITYGERLPGFADKTQIMINVTNPKCMVITIEDERFSILEGELLSFSRILDYKTGVLRRQVTWRSPKGRELDLLFERVASLTQKHLAVIHCTIIPKNFSGTIMIDSILDGDVRNYSNKKDPRVGHGFTGRVLYVEKVKYDGNNAVVLQKTKNTGFTLACAVLHELDTQCSRTIEDVQREQQIGHKFIIDAKEGQEIHLTKFVSYYTSKNKKIPDLSPEAYETVKKAWQKGYPNVLAEQKAYLEDFWRVADIEVVGDDEIQAGILFNMFHLLQSVGKDGKTNIAAKGLSGEGYQGHYFWDTEIYVMPFFIHTKPEIARTLMEYRHLILPKARKRAKEMSHKRGALYPWRTIDGEECSPYFLAGTAQYHIVADIAYAIQDYYDATEDEEFMINAGAEILFETALLWLETGEYIPSKGNQFCITGVTGPDEYTVLVDNNCYTNVMAKENLTNAYNIAHWLEKEHPDELKRLQEQIGLTKDDVSGWKKAADSMYVPFDEQRGIHPQDDAFLDKPVWDLTQTPEDHFPLLLHYHPLIIYRHQVCKQADVLLAEFLLPYNFSKEQKKRDYDYYEKLTTHDSSLSPCVFSIMASQVGYHEKAYDYFMKTARLDLDNLKGNTQDGLHMANLGGTWMALVMGFGGMQAYNDKLSFNPQLPKLWSRLTFRVQYKNRLLEICMTQESTNVRLVEGESIEIYLEGKLVQL